MLTDVEDFGSKILFSNRKILPEIDVSLEHQCSFEETQRLGNIEYVGLFVYFYTETIGDIKHYIPDTYEYDPAFMRCRVQSIIVLYGNKKRKSFEGVSYTPYKTLAETRFNDIIQTILRNTEEFILPKLLELGLPISKDAWENA